MALMSRPLHIAYPGAWYHLMNRVRRGGEIFDERKRKMGSSLELSVYRKSYISRLDPIFTDSACSLRQIKVTAMTVWVVWGRDMLQWKRERHAQEDVPER